VRSRKLLAGFATVLLALVSMAATASAASAQEKPKLKEAEEHCIKLLEQGNKTIDDCQKAPSPILPAKNELIWGIISFVALFGLLYKFAWPGLKKSLEGRTAHIRAELDAAESEKAEASQILAEYQAQLADAKNESARIIEEARQTADALKRDQEQRLQSELAEMRQKAVADIEAAKAQAIADLRGEVATLAIAAAERVVERNLDRDTNVALVEAYINQVAATN
jgi:F-type H+-transporting ATPase subunit b